MSFKAIEIVALIPVLVSVIAIIVANRAVTRSLRPVLVFVCEVRDKVWCVQNVGTGPALDVVVAEKDRNEQPWARFSGCRLYRRMEKSNCDQPRVFLRLPTTTLRTTLIRRSAQGIGIDFRRAMSLMNLMRTRLLFTHPFPRIQPAKVRLLSGALQGDMTRRDEAVTMFTIAAIAVVCMAAAPPVTFDSPCSRRDNHGKACRLLAERR
jgi:hypothetical protein